MNAKIVYQTDQLGIYTGTTQADPSPLEPDVWLFPGGCVETPPPSAGEHQVARWDGQRWQLISSYQGLTAYSTSTGEPLVIERTGALPPGYTLSAPALGQVWRNGEWVDDIPAALVRRHAELYQSMNVACEAAITAGFTSDALGEPHFYSSQLDDQLNLTGAVVRGLDMPYACRDEQGAKEFRLHTAEQLRQVGDDFTLYKLQLLQHANALKDQLDAALEAGDLAALETITWGAPQS
uniref:Putative tail protein n=1 Tax=viral metagenome TaxID=1070528 RepID=A0A6H1ZE61_9ZZZZ